MKTLLLVGFMRLLALAAFLLLFWRQKLNKNTERFSAASKDFLLELDALGGEYIDHSRQEILREKFSTIYREALATYQYNLLARIKFSGGIVAEFLQSFANLQTIVDRKNQTFAIEESKKFRDIFDNIDGKSLDEQQTRAVVTDDNYNLVLAGAGSGKTLTIAAKVKYLVDCKNISPEQILLISFTRASAAEMGERISGRLDIDITSQTFHKLGLEIIKKRYGRRPEILECLDDVINDFLSGESSDEAMKQKILLFLGCYLAAPQNLEDFDSLGDYFAENRSIQLKTLRGKVAEQEYLNDRENKMKQEVRTIIGEKVKSFEEVAIANFLFVNGVDYVYEREYPHSNPDSYRKKYRPDFYLPDYDIYIEHFRVNEDFKTPWLSDIEQEKYLNDMRWKRAEHAKNGTKLIETYSFYNTKGVLFEKLEQMLKLNGVRFQKINFTEAIAGLFESDQAEFDDVRKLLATFIGLFKSSGRTQKDFAEIRKSVDSNDSQFFKMRGNLFLDIAEMVFEKYQTHLKNNGAIDFNDMINNAAEIVESGALKFPYSYIVIDEYQDIAAGRFRLVRALIDKTGAKLMCVGDDWQSIYRFSGSDLALFTGFENEVGYHKLLRIEKTYRNSQELIDIAGKFVMKNPQQFKKALRSDLRCAKPIELVEYDNSGDKNKTLIHMLDALEQTILAIVKDFGTTKTIFILGRNNFDIQIINKDPKKRFETKPSRNGIIVAYLGAIKLKIRFMTVHKSKGLEADNVILINLNNDTFGFPNKVVDDPILRYVLTDKDEMIHAEERRLFYVAITRTRNKTFLLAPSKNASIFVEEIKKDFGIDPNSSDNRLLCPHCKTGVLVGRSGKNGDFVGCENYPLCQYTNNHTEILRTQKMCRKCGDYMVVRRRKIDRKKFWGCVNYPDCKNTLEV